MRAIGIDCISRRPVSDLDSADVDIPDHPWGMQRITGPLTMCTRYVDAFFFFADAAAAGIRQVVILASGLDARGY